MINKDELKKFCNDNLAYLLDNGFNIQVYYRMDYISIYIYLKSSSIFLQTSPDRFPLNNIPKTTFKKFNWFNVCDDIMPFLQILVKKYEPYENFFVLHGEEVDTWSNKITIKRAESGYNSFDRELYYIEIEIKKYEKTN